MRRLRKISRRGWITIFGLFGIVMVIGLLNPPEEEEAAPTATRTLVQATATDRPTPTDTLTRVPSATVRPTENSPVATVEDVALLDCTQVTCERVVIIPAGERVTVIDVTAGDDVDGTMWNLVQWGEYQGFVPASRLEVLPSPTLTPSATITETATSTATPTATLTRTPIVMNTAVPRATQPPAQPTAPPAAPVATSIPRPGNCSTAVAMGLTAQQAAQWSHLDRDDDGVACYGD